MPLRRSAAAPRSISLNRRSPSDRMRFSGFTSLCTRPALCSACAHASDQIRLHLFQPHQADQTLDPQTGSHLTYASMDKLGNTNKLMQRRHWQQQAWIYVLPARMRRGILLNISILKHKIKTISGEAGDEVQACAAHTVKASVTASFADANQACCQNRLGGAP